MNILLHPPSIYSSCNTGLTHTHIHRNFVMQKKGKWLEFTGSEERMPVHARGEILPHISIQVKALFTGLNILLSIVPMECFWCKVLRNNEIPLLGVSKWRLTGILCKCVKKSLESSNDMCKTENIETVVHNSKIYAAILFCCGKPLNYKSVCKLCEDVALGHSCGCFFSCF